MRAVGVVVTVAMVATLLSFSAVAASSPPPQPSVTAVTADLEGRPLATELISTYFCHDFDFPEIHCYRSAAALAQAERRWGAIDGKMTTQSAAFGATDYVSIFDGYVYTGAGMDLSQSYDTLVSIAWNDRISSYKGRNSRRGQFWTDWFATGSGLSFCCNSQVSSLPTGFNDSITSVYAR